MDWNSTAENFIREVGNMKEAIRFSIKEVKRR
jgi:hypothetical protein